MISQLRTYQNPPVRTAVSKPMAKKRAVAPMRLAGRSPGAQSRNTPRPQVPTAARMPPDPLAASTRPSAAPQETAARQDRTTRVPDARAIRNVSANQATAQEAKALSQ